MRKTRKAVNLPKKVQRIPNHKLHTDLITINETIIQATRRTKDGMVSLTELCNAFNELNGTDKRVQNYLRQQSTNDLIAELQNDVVAPNSATRIVSHRNKYGTWGHPLLWLDFAMWLSPKFKLACLKLISDKVIPIRLDTIQRHKDLQLLLSESLNLSVGHWISIQQDLNQCAFGCERNEAKQLRDNKANEDALKRLQLLQTTIGQMVETNIFTCYHDIQEYLKRYFKNTWGKEMYKKDRDGFITVEDIKKDSGGSIPEELDNLIGF